MNINHTKLLDEPEAGTITYGHNHNGFKEKKMISLYGDAT
jgi:hypothetical protein